MMVEEFNAEVPNLTSEIVASLMCDTPTLGANLDWLCYGIPIIHSCFKCIQRFADAFICYTIFNRIPNKLDQLFNILFFSFKERLSLDLIEIDNVRGQLRSMSATFVGCQVNQLGHGGYKFTRFQVIK